MIDTNKLNDIVTIYRWDYEHGMESRVEISLLDAIINPNGLHMGKLGVVLLNKFREDLGLEPFSLDQNY